MPGPKMTDREVRTFKRMLKKQPALVEKWRERAKVLAHDFTTQCHGCGDVRDWFGVYLMRLFCHKCGCKSMEVLIRDGIAQ